jgi:hypothetical protein
MALSIRRKRINTVLGLLLLGGLVYMFWPFVVGRGQMQTFCASLPNGASLAQVNELVSARGYHIVVGSDGMGLVHDTRSFGRFLCQTHFQNEKLVRANYLNND